MQQHTIEQKSNARLMSIVAFLPARSLMRNIYFWCDGLNCIISCISFTVLKQPLTRDLLRKCDEMEMSRDM